MESPRKRQLKEEQTRLLNEHKDVVKSEGALMRKASDSDDLKAVLSHANVMLDELRTGSLTPKVRGAARRCSNPPSLHPAPSLPPPPHTHTPAPLGHPAALL